MLNKAITAQADLFADMEERDGHIFSEMDKRKKGIKVWTGVLSHQKCI